MIEEEALSMLIYQHVQQLTLLDYPLAEAFNIAHRTAAAAFDQEFTRAGLDKARNALRKELRDRQLKVAAKSPPEASSEKSGASP